jgi:hypothetical protein
VRCGAGGPQGRDTRPTVRNTKQERIQTGKGETGRNKARMRKLPNEFLNNAVKSLSGCGSVWLRLFRASDPVTNSHTRQRERSESFLEGD